VRSFWRRITLISSFSAFFFPADEGLEVGLRSKAVSRRTWCSLTLTPAFLKASSAASLNSLPREEERCKHYYVMIYAYAAEFPEINSAEPELLLELVEGSLG